MTYWSPLIAFCIGALVAGIWISIRSRPRSAPKGPRTQPVPAPLGWYWTLGESGVTRGNGKHAFARLYLVEFGRTIDRLGLYEGREPGDWPPAPRWGRTVDREQDLRRESIKLLAEFRQEHARKAALEDARRRLEEES